MATIPLSILLIPDEMLVQSDGICFIRIFKGTIGVSHIMS